MSAILHLRHCVLDHDFLPQTELRQIALLLRWNRHHPVRVHLIGFFLCLFRCRAEKNSLFYKIVGCSKYLCTLSLPLAYVLTRTWVCSSKNEDTGSSVGYRALSVRTWGHIGHCLLTDVLLSLSLRTIHIHNIQALQVCRWQDAAGLDYKITSLLSSDQV